MFLSSKSTTFVFGAILENAWKWLKLMHFSDVLEFLKIKIEKRKRVDLTSAAA
jgi:hypothetical protein